MAGHLGEATAPAGSWSADGAIPGLDVPDLIRRHSAAARAMQVG
jgi:8-oxoguanine deaminase